MSSFATARYALWHHSSQRLQGTLAWRETPRSKKLLTVAPPSCLAGHVTVVAATAARIELHIDAAQADAIAQWTSALPPDVMQSTAETDRCIVHQGPYARIDGCYQATSALPQPGDQVRVRLSAEVTSIGPLRKAHVVVTDVQLADVAAQ